MLVKIFPHGAAKGSSARNPVDYLLDSQDHRHQVRAVAPELLRGDPALTKDLIDSAPFKQRYTSGVISFSPEESKLLNPELRQSLMDSFEHMVLPGLPKDSTCWLWVLHAEHARFELHWVVPNVDLDTGKRLSPYYDRADQPRFAAWQNYHNLLQGLADPQDPNRRRAFAISRWLSREAQDNALELTTFLREKCIRGELRTRNDVIEFVENELELKVPRRGKDYITVQYGDERNERFRLRSEFCHEDYRFESTFAGKASRLSQPSTADRERAAFKSLENDLNGLLRAEKSAIANALASRIATFNEQNAQIQKSTIIQSRRMLWMLKFPLLFTAIACLTTCSGSEFRTGNEYTCPGGRMARKPT